MSLIDLRKAMAIILKDLEKAIVKALTDTGVPTGAATLYEFVEIIYPVILQARREIYAEQVIQMGLEIAEYGLQVKPATLRDYAPSATFKTFASALNIGEDRRAALPIEFMDDVTRAARGDKIIITDDNRHAPEVIEKAAKKLTAAAERHARDAGRQAVIDTAAGGQVRAEPRNETTPQSYRRTTTTGEELGWARVLTGDENCAFCAMLASRGPVYSEETVLTAGSKSSREGMTYHANCDCAAVLVIKGRKWQGETEYKKLKSMWDNATENPTKDEIKEGLEQPLDRFAKRWSAVEDKTRYAPGTEG
ncbi:hypothetical protein SFC07_11070 [Corynebacterium callunae]|uniref:VG15 protein n=1 Tax=Corynebacterium callunae TaxID=1721 RepID=UPI00398217EB